MDELTRITHGPAGFTVTTGYELVLATNATRDEALTALWHRGLTPQVAVASLHVAKVDGHVLVHGLAAA